jgi:lipid-binding SYLF domain-containing protein
MTRLSPLGATLLLLLVVESTWAGSQEAKTLESAAAVVKTLSSHRVWGIPRSLFRRAAGVAIVPNVCKGGLVIDVRAGRGVVLIRALDGTWSNPVFVSLKGGGVGGQAGIETTDLVLVFMTRKSLERALNGKLALGGDLTVAVGPVGEEAAAAADARLKADIYSYSQSRGLYAGFSLDGAQLRVKTKANEKFYDLQRGGVEQVLAFRGASIPPAAALIKSRLAMLSMPPAPPVIPVPFQERPPTAPAVCQPFSQIFLCMDLSPRIRELTRGVGNWAGRNVHPQLSGRLAEWGEQHWSSEHHASHRERD